MILQPTDLKLTELIAITALTTAALNLEFLNTQGTLKQYRTANQFANNPEQYLNSNRQQPFGYTLRNNNHTNISTQRLKEQERNNLKRGKYGTLLLSIKS